MTAWVSILFRASWISVVHVLMGKYCANDSPPMWRYHKKKK